VSAYRFGKGAQQVDYDFLRDITGQVQVRFSMGHEAIGHWLNEEVKGNLALLDQIVAAANQLRGSERQWQLPGHEYTLFLDDEEVMVRANQLLIDTDCLEEGMSYYDEESLAFCGLDDFLLVLEKYRAFISSHH
jgi:uncharacterized protein YacL (UPF0231 family)